MLHPVGIPFTQKGAANGVATLDGAGKVPSAQMPLDSLSYQGTWNASANTPTLASGVGTSGYYYLVSVAGATDLDGITDWQIGDRAIFEGTVWQKIDSTDAAHLLGGGQHLSDTLANLNSKVSDATLVDTLHAHDGVGGGGQVDHLNLSNVGTKTHAQVDSHIATVTGNPHFVGVSDLFPGTLANLNSKVSDATILDKVHGHTGGADGSILNLPGPLDWAIDGTVTVGIGTPDVVGAGTNFTWYLKEGRRVGIAGEEFLVLTITDDTHLALDSNHSTGASGVSLYREFGNTVLGTDALKAGVNLGFDITAIGFHAAKKTTEPWSRSCAFGAYALKENTTGSQNSAFGYSALEDNIDGLGGVAFGHFALSDNKDGHRNTAVGETALKSNISGSHNTAVGSEALCNSIGSANVAVGHHAAYANTSGEGNVAVGRNSLDSNQTGDRNVAIGFEAGYNETGSEKLYIAKGRSDEDVLIFGDFATRQLMLPPINLAGPLDTAALGTVTVGIGTPNVVGVGTYFTYEYIGAQLIIADETHTILSITDDTHMTLVANHVAGAAGVSYYTEKRNVAHGTDALKTGAKWDNTAVGYKALEKTTDAAYYSSAFGAGALMANTTGVKNSAFGWRALAANVGGGSNAAFGVTALWMNTGGSRNIALGDSALSENLTGDDNIALGVNTLRGGAGNGNIALGTQALYNTAAGDRNVAIGYKAGYNETGSEKLYIAKGPDAADVLIYGDFATRQIGIGTATPDASSILDLTSTLLGFLPPRMTNTQRDAIGSPATALLLWSTTDDKFNYYNGSNWRSLVNSPAATIAAGGIPFGHADGCDCICTDAANLFWDNTGKNLGLGTADQFGGGAGVVGLNDAGTVPTSNPTGGGALYSEGGALKWRGSSGTVTQVAPA
jgi:hypothetical protein